MTHPFTLTYIAMAKAAEEIQAMRPDIPDAIGFYPQPCSDLGSFFIDPSNALHVLHWDNDEDRWIIGDYTDDESEWPWLPRLDQLLGMLEVGPRVHQLQEIVTALSGEDHIAAEAYPNLASDWHTFSLAALMLMKFGKRWRDGKWEKA